MEQLRLDIGIEWTDNALAEQSRAEQSLSLSEKIIKAKEAIVLASNMSKEFYHKPLVVTYSGGKDSDVLLHLVEDSLNTGDFEVLNSHTTVDAPETVRHIREVFKRLNEEGVKTTIYQPKDENGNPVTMWNLIPRKQIPPSRLVRYCCEVLKEASSPNTISLTGVRGSESRTRQGRDIFNVSKNKQEHLHFSLDHAEEVFKESLEIQDDTWDCTLIKRMKENEQVIVTPIYYWLDNDIWDYIRQEKIKYNPLYDLGFTRVGCVMCPLATRKNVQRELQIFPKYKKMYISAFDRMLEARKANGKSNSNSNGTEWKTGEDVFNWYIGEQFRNCQGQLSIFGDEDERAINT